MILSTLKSRIEKLEKSIPVKNPFADLTIEELNDRIFSFHQDKSHKGIEPDLETLLTNQKCRQFCKEGMPWVMDRNHRLSVFLKFNPSLDFKNNNFIKNKQISNM